jgi:hypothetical protein
MMVEPNEQFDARRRASDTVAYMLSFGFDAARLDDRSRAIYDDWIRRSESNAQMVGLVFGSARLTIKAGRLAGLDEDSIRHDFLGGCHDVADMNSIPGRRGDDEPPRADFMELMKAVYDQAAVYPDDRDWEELVREVERTLTPEADCNEGYTNEDTE